MKFSIRIEFYNFPGNGNSSHSIVLIDETINICSLVVVSSIFVYSILFIHSGLPLTILTVLHCLLLTILLLPFIGSLLLFTRFATRFIDYLFLIHCLRSHALFTHLTFAHMASVAEILKIY